MKFSIFHSIYILLLSASLSVMEVKGQGTGFTVPTSCNSATPNANDENYYSGQTVYQLLCEVDTGTNNMADPAPMFTRFCGLVNQYANLKNLLNTTSSRVTVLAPVDAAFSKVNLQGFTTIQAQRVLDLHVFPTIRSLEDLVAVTPISLRIRRPVHSSKCPKRNVTGLPALVDSFKSDRATRVGAATCRDLVAPPVIRFLSRLEPIPPPFQLVVGLRTNVSTRPTSMRTQSFVTA